MHDYIVLGLIAAVGDFDLVAEALGLMIVVLGLRSAAEYLLRARFAVNC